MSATANLAEWLARIERAHPQQIELGLERVAAVAARMGISSATLPPAVVVGGTNGKGSCVAVMERLLAVQGLRVGTYTSPHLRRYTERVRIDGREAGEAALCAAFAGVEAARVDVPLTYFEFGTLAALALFREAGLDRLVLEVGLGGRLDAVNIVDAEVAVVTSIQIDHTEWLGNDRASIAREKAGIFRAARPAVVAERDVPVTLRESAEARGAHWFGIGADFDCGTRADGAWWWRGRRADGSACAVDGLPLPQLHADNVAAALQALALWDALPAPAVLVAELPRIGVEGRFQRRQVDGLGIVLEVAHNPGGMALLATRLLREPVAGRTVAVVGAMRDKDIAAMLAALQPAVNDWVFTDLPEGRAAAAVELAAALPGVDARCVATLAEALPTACALAAPQGRVVVCGSFHTVGPALDWIDARQAVRGVDA